MSQNPSAYTLSLGHIEDLTLPSLAYLRTPLLVAGIAFLLGAFGTFRAIGQRAFLAAAVMAVLFFQAARMALVVFDPFLSSRPLAEALLHSPPGKLMVDHHYYTFSSIFFYTNRDALVGERPVQQPGVWLLRAGRARCVHRRSTMEGALACSRNAAYLVVRSDELPRLEHLVGRDRLETVAESGGKLLLTNRGMPLEVR